MVCRRTDFTLIGLLVVTAITAIPAAAAPPAAPPGRPGYFRGDLRKLRIVQR